MDTVEKFLKKKKYPSFNENGGLGVHYVKEAMIEFAKLHTQEALKQASEKATVTPVDHEEISEGSFRPIWGVDDSSILNAYSLDNIK